MQLFRFLFVAILSLALAAPCFAKSVTRARLISWPNPSKLGLPAVMLAEVDGLGGGAPKGVVTFTEGDKVLGSRPINPYGAGQAALAAGMDHSCALTAAGGVACWGSNYYGQLGDGTHTQRRTPVGVSSLASDVTAIAAGSVHNCALMRTGAVKCWGFNDGAQLGDGTSIEAEAPVDVVGLTGGIVAIALGRKHSCALTSGGGVKCWGTNDFGQIGIAPRYAVAPTPVTVSALSSGIVAIDVGDAHNCALTKGGNIRCWGDNSWGQLGTDSAVRFAFTPVAVSGLGGSAIAIAAGGGLTCALISGGAVKCWGEGFGPRPVAISLPSREAVAIAAGKSDGIYSDTVHELVHLCALSKAGAVSCLDLETHNWIDVPSLSSGAVAITVGRYHDCALMLSGAVKCWGYNAWGQLGDGTSIDWRITPSSVARFTALVRSRTWTSTRTLGVGVHGLRASYHGDSFHGGSTATHKHAVVE